MSFGVTPDITIFTDGGVRGNGKKKNVGGWGAVIQHRDDTTVEMYDSAFNTTNNQQELTAIIKALESLESTDKSIAVYSDSKYCIDGITSWRHNWIKNNWITSTKKPVANKELWQRLIELSDRQRNIRYFWVKGHQDEGSVSAIVQGNILVDALVNQAMDAVEGEMNKT